MEKPSMIEALRTLQSALQRRLARLQSKGLREILAAAKVVSHMFLCSSLLVETPNQNSWGFDLISLILGFCCFLPWSS